MSALAISWFATLAIAATPVQKCDAHFHTGMTAADYDQTQFDEAAAGYRLVREGVIDDAGSPRFTALWVHDGLPQRQSRGGHGVDRFYAASLEMVGRGYRLVDLSVAVVSGAPWFAALWEQPRGAQQTIEYSLGRDELRNALASHGRRVVAIAPYRIGKIPYFAAAFDVGADLEPTAGIGLSSKALAHQDREMTARGYGISRRIVEPGESGRVTALWEPVNATSPCRSSGTIWPIDP